MQQMDIEVEQFGQEQQFISLLDAYEDKQDAFFVITLCFGIISSFLVTILIIQLFKVPADNIYVLKGSIWLVFGTICRVFGCFFLFLSYWLNKKDSKINKPQAFATITSEFALELPLYFF